MRRKDTFIPPMKGKKMSEAAREKMREAAKSRPSHRRGVKHTLATRKKISEISRERTPRGMQAHSYKDGKSAERRGQRFSPEYKRWHYDVYSRDTFTCQHCGDNRGGNLVAHHIVFANDDPARFDTDHSAHSRSNANENLPTPLCSQSAWMAGEATQVAGIAST